VGVSWYWFVAVVLIAIYFALSSIVEERIMERRPPETYSAYKQSTKRLIPLIL
jgi:protein-S-isoprenylcysteine O-methyltransferase Ste14